MPGTVSRREFMGAAAAAAVAARRPNLIFVCADQLRYQSCGYAGDQFARTPAMDRLAAESLNLRNAVSSSPVCAPYRAALLTGKYQSSTGMVINELRLSPEHECFGHVLTRHGYQTAFIGKWHLWANEMGGHDKAVNGFVPPGPYRLGFDGYWAGYNFNHRYFDAPYFENEPERRIHKRYEPESQTGLAIRFVSDAAKRPDPFAVFLAWGPPHDPWTPDNVPPEYAEMFRGVEFPPAPNVSEVSDPYADNWAKTGPQYGKNMRQFMRAYYGQTASVDACLGRLLKALKENDVERDTIVVFTSDHGEMFGAHGRRAKNIFYEEAVRVPFLVRWPARVKPGVSDACLGSPDIMPTLLSLMGLPVPKAAEGADLSGLALGARSREPAAAFLQGMGTTAAWTDGTEWRGLRDRRYTYGIYHRDRRELLFDRKADPWQMKNLAEERAHAATLGHYRSALQGWMKQHNDEFRNCTWYRDNWTADRNIVNTATGVGQDLKALAAIIRRYFRE